MAIAYKHSAMFQASGVQAYLISKIIFAALWYIQTIAIMNQKDNTLDIAVAEESHASGNSYWNLNLIKSHDWYLVVSHQNVDLFRSNLVWQQCCSHHMAFISLEASTRFNNVPFDCQKKKCPQARKVWLKERADHENKPGRAPLVGFAFLWCSAFNRLFDMVVSKDNQSQENRKEVWCDTKLLIWFEDQQSFYMFGCKLPPQFWATQSSKWPRVGCQSVQRNPQDVAGHAHQNPSKNSCKMMIESKCQVDLESLCTAIKLISKTAISYRWAFVTRVWLPFGTPNGQW